MTSSILNSLTAWSYHYSGLVGPETPSADEAFELYRRNSGFYLSRFVCPPEQVRAVRAAGEATGYDDLHLDIFQRVSGDWRREIADTVSDLKESMASPVFVAESYRLLVPDPAMAAEVERFAVEATGGFDWGGIFAVNVGFELHAAIAETSRTLAETDSFVWLDPVEPGAVEFLAAYLAGQDGIERIATIANGRRPTLTRSLADGRLEIGWLNLRLAMGQQGAEKSEILAETSPEAFVATGQEILWRGNPAPLSDGLTGCDSDTIRDFEAQLGWLGWAN